jgi:putative NADH-flavin reductase
MKLAIIGATGGTGEQVVRQALEQGYLVKAFSRNPAKLGIQHPNLELLPGDVLQLADVEQAIKGSDAVICTLGAPASDKSKLRTEGTKQIIQAMQSQGVERLICLSSLGFGDSRPMLPFVLKYIIIPFILKNVMADHESQEAIIKQSNLNWTIVRPGNLSDGPATRAYRYGFPFDKSAKIKKIARADVADFMLRQLQENTYHKKTVGISM